MKISDTIKKIREAAKMTQVEFATAIGCQQASISKFEKGSKTPSLHLAKKIVRLAKSKKIKITLLDIFPDEID